MAEGRKPDAMPLLAPGGHLVSLSEIHTRFVQGVRNEVHREKLFLGLEELVQRLLLAEIPCEFWVDGSFLTEKEFPDDIDIFILVDSDVNDSLDEEKTRLLLDINTGYSPIGMDAQVYTIYNRGHSHFGTSADVGREWASGYGIENSEKWLKGYAILRLRETDVGLRIRS